MAVTFLCDNKISPRGSPTEQLLHVTQEYATPLLESQWPNDPHGTVTDYWIEAIRVAADTEY